MFAPLASPADAIGGVCLAIGCPTLPPVIVDNEPPVAAGNGQGGARLNATTGRVTGRLGGLTDRQHEVDASGIPILSRIPFIGGLFGSRLNHLELKYSQAEAMPFGRMKVRLKREIVTLGDKSADPTRQVGIYVEPSEWNALISSADTLVIDTRNAFEVEQGSFDGARHLGLARFESFPDRVDALRDEVEGRTVPDVRL